MGADMLPVACDPERHAHLVELPKPVPRLPYHQNVQLAFRAPASIRLRRRRLEHMDSKAKLQRSWLRNILHQQTY